MNNKEKLNEFQRLIEYKFHDKGILKQALYTAQYGNLHNRGKHCKEFTTIGDIILKLILALKVYDDGFRTPGGITLSKQIIESNDMFGIIADKEFNLSKYIFSVKGEDLENSNIMADVFEAIAGAIYFDSNRSYKQVQEKIVDKFYEKYKTKLFENL